MDRTHVITDKNGRRLIPRSRIDRRYAGKSSGRSHRHQLTPHAAGRPAARKGINHVKIRSGSAAHAAQRTLIGCRLSDQPILRFTSICTARSAASRCRDHQHTRAVDIANADAPNSGLADEVGWDEIIAGTLLGTRTVA
jgi:hypothetical protein